MGSFILKTSQREAKVFICDGYPADYYPGFAILLNHALRDWTGARNRLRAVHSVRRNLAQLHVIHCNLQYPRYRLRSNKWDKAGFDGFRNFSRQKKNCRRRMATTHGTIFFLGCRSGSAEPKPRKKKLKKNSLNAFIKH